MAKQPDTPVCDCGNPNGPHDPYCATQVVR